VLHIYMTLVT